MTSLESALRRAALLFRILAVVWMAVMVGISLVTDRDSRVWLVIISLLVAIGGAYWSARYLASERPLDNVFLLKDAAVALAVAIAPQLAGAADAFYGGYPMSAVVLVAMARDVGWGLTAAGVFVATQGVALLSGAPSAPSPAEWVSLAVMAAVVGMVVALGAEFLRSAERRRADAEEALEEERRRHAVEEARLAERVGLADDLHDSLLQTVRVLGQSAGEPERVRSLARRQERELRGLIERMHGDGRPRAAAALRAEAADVEDLHGVPIDVVASGDVEADESMTELIRAAREVMVNAARHSGSLRIDVTLEATGSASVAVVVRDRGRGFDPDTGDAGHGLASVRDRLERLGGSIKIDSASGRGTEVEIALPRSRT